MDRQVQVTSALVELAAAVAGSVLIATLAGTVLVGVMVLCSWVSSALSGRQFAPAFPVESPGVTRKLFASTATGLMLTRLSLMIVTTFRRASK